MIFWWRKMKNLHRWIHIIWGRNFDQVSVVFQLLSFHSDTSRYVFFLSNVLQKGYLWQCRDGITVIREKCVGDIKQNSIHTHKYLLILCFSYSKLIRKKWLMMVHWYKKQRLISKPNFLSISSIIPLQDKCVPKCFYTISKPIIRDSLPIFFILNRILNWTDKNSTDSEVLTNAAIPNGKYIYGSIRDILFGFKKLLQSIIPLSWRLLQSIYRFKLTISIAPRPYTYKPTYFYYNSFFLLVDSFKPMSFGWVKNSFLHSYFGSIWDILKPFETMMAPNN